VKKRYFTLDGMRGIAAIAILTVHGGSFFGAFGLPEGSLAVDFFFALSGFVVAEAYSARLAQTLTWIKFMRLRLVRFYPLYLLGTLLGFVPWAASFLFGNPMHATPWGGISALFLGLLMLPSPLLLTLPGEGVFRTFYPLLMVAWSLFWELIANAFYGAFWKRLNRGLLITLLGLGALGLCLSMWRMGSLGGDVWGWTAEWSAASRVCFSFCAGLLLQRTPRSGLKFPPLFLLIVLLLFLGFEPGDAACGIYVLVFVMIMSPALIYLGAATEPTPGLESGIYTFLGATSYAVYVIGYPAEVLVHMLFKHLHAPVESFAPWSGLLFTAGLLLLCGWLDKFFDEPVRRWLGRSSSRAGLDS
jgi:peptidoglycan/LPS O-acetylase OafA/YrhL